MIVVTLLTLAAAAAFLYAAWSDFRRWRIPNGTIATLLLLYALVAVAVTMTADDTGAALFSRGGVGGDIAAGLLLFVLGVVLWGCGLFGAGDAKLFLPIGLFVGWDGMLPFAVCLLVGGVAALLALRLPAPLQLAHLAFFTRLDEIRTSRKIPYGVIMVFAALATMVLQQAAV